MWVYDDNAAQVVATAAPQFARIPSPDGAGHGDCSGHAAMNRSVGIRLAAAVATVLALALCAGNAAAQDAPAQKDANVATQDAAARKDVWSRPLAVEGVLGFGTPVGYAGVMLEYSPHPRFIASVGAGIGGGTENTDCLKSGYSGVCEGPFSDRVQLAAMGRVRLFWVGSTAMTVGAGASGGGYSWDEFTTDEPAHKSADRAYWANVEVGGEHRAQSGFSARWFVGLADMLNPGALHCIDTGINPEHCPTVHKDSGHWLVYFGGGVGWAF